LVSSICLINKYLNSVLRECLYGTLFFYAGLKEEENLADADNVFYICYDRREGWWLNDNEKGVGRAGRDRQKGGGVGS
jgi:hypothetical protein